MNNLLKVLFVVSVSMMSMKVWAQEWVVDEGLVLQEADDESSLTLPSYAYPVVIKSSEEQREESYQIVIEELEQMEASNPSNANPKIPVKIDVMSSAKIDENSMFDFLMEIMAGMPKGSYRNFNYFTDADRPFISTKVDRDGLEHLYSLGVIYIGLDVVYFH